MNIARFGAHGGGGSEKCCVGVCTWVCVPMCGEGELTFLCAVCRSAPEEEADVNQWAAKPEVSPAPGPAKPDERLEAVKDYMVSPCCCLGYFVEEIVHTS